jgi:hypothetical protein
MALKRLSSTYQSSSAALSSKAVTDGLFAFLAIVFIFEHELDAA